MIFTQYVYECKAPHCSRHSPSSETLAHSLFGTLIYMYFSAFVFLFDSLKPIEQCLYIFMYVINHYDLIESQQHHIDLAYLLL